VLAAAAGTLATWPLVAHLSGDTVRDDTVPAVVTGILLGVVGAAAALRRRTPESDPAE
jgi:MYXO-CTERM domain-containing protein